MNLLLLRYDPARTGRWGSRSVCAPLIAVLAVACNTPPGAPTVAIIPDDPLTDDVLEVVVQGGAADGEGDAVSYAYAWFVDGAPTAHTGTTVPAEETTRGETWKVVVTPSDGKADGAVGAAEVTIGNTAPVVTLALDPVAPSGADDITAVATAEDTDGDEVTLTWAWTRDGANAGISGDTLAAGVAARGEAWTVTATPSDDALDGEPVTVAFTVANAPPSLESVTVGPSGATVADTLVATFTGAEDLDGDAVSVDVTWSVDGVDVLTETVDADGASELSGVFAKGQEVVVTAVPNDGYDDGAAVVSAALTIANAAPSATGARVSPEPLYADSVVTCVGDGWADPDGDAPGWRTTWTVAGAAVSTEDTLPVGTFARGDTVTCTLEPDDGESAGPAVTSAAVVVANSPPACAAAAVTIGPDPATLGDPLAVATDGYSGCADVDGDAIVEVYDWRVDGVSASTGATLAAGTAPRGSSVVLVTGWSDGIALGAEATSNTVTIVNRAPVASALSLSPDAVTTDDVVSALVTTSDADGDTLSLSYAWTVDGVAAGTGATLDGATAFSRGQTVALTVTPHDGWDAGAPLSTSTVVANAPPSSPAVRVLPASPGDDDALVCSITAAAADPDGDTVAYTFAWTVGGVPYPGATTTLFPGDTIPASVTLNGQSWTCAVTPSDGSDAGTPGAASVEIGCDLDGDGYDGEACGGPDCDDTNAARSPAASEVCDAADVDEDCDGLSDDADPSLVGAVYYPDADGDTYGDSDGGVAACTRPAGWLTNGDDCDDTRATVKPGGYEVCDSLDLDEDCDGLADDADPGVSWRISQYVDADGDGYGDEGAAVVYDCDLLAGYARDHTDCDDGDDTISPGADEVCADGIDNDCDERSAPCGIEGSHNVAYATLTGSYDFGWQGGVGDFDGDGVQDVFATGVRQLRSEVWYGPIAEGSRDWDTSDVTFTVPSSWWSIGESAAAIPDMDGDGDDEILIGASTGTYGYGTYAYLLEGGTFADSDISSLPKLGSSTGSPNGPAMGSAGDFDGDGFGDLFLGYQAAWGSSSRTNSLTLYRGDASGTWSSSTWSVTGGGFGYKNGAVSAGDMDGDGLDDLLATHVPYSGTTGTFALLGEAGPVSDTLSVAADAWFTSATFDYPCAPGDVNDDGYADAGISNGTTVYLLLGPPTGDVTSSSAYATVSGFKCVAGDTDADGASETFFWVNGNYAYRYPHPLSSGALTDAIGSTSNVATEIASVGDVTDDGYDDLVLFYYYGTVAIYTGGEW